MKITAIDILKYAGIKTPGDKFGKFRVNIGGITANDPNKIVNVQDETEVEVIVGREKFTAKLPKKLSNAAEERVAEQLKAKGEKATEAFEARQKEKRKERDE